MTQAVDSMAAHPSVLLSLLLFLLLLLLFLLVLLLLLFFSSCPSDVPLHVQGQVIRPGETPVAVVALEWLRSGVFAVVSCQLVTAGKAPFAALP